LVHLVEVGETANPVDGVGNLFGLIRPRKTSELADELTDGEVGATLFPCVLDVGEDEGL
jgi:hypothetical protein